MWSKLSFALLLVVCTLHSCVHEPDAVPATQKGVYVVNEGNFNFGTAEISSYDTEKKNVVNGLFQAANSYSLGDVAQSMLIHDSIAFIVVNNSAKIEVVRISDFKKLRTISIPGSSPRYILPVDESIAYVTDLYAGKVHVINYQTGSVVKEIPEANPWTEHLLKAGSNVFVEERSYSADNASVCSLIKLNGIAHNYVQRATFNGGNLNGLVLDKQQRIWVAVEQDSIHGVASALVCLNQDLAEVKRLTFPMGHHPSNLSIDGAGEELYFLDKGIYRVSIGEVSIPSDPFIPLDNRNFYALGIHPSSGDVYVSDALDYVQPSIIFRYSNSGALLDNFHAGIISGNFCFKP